MNKFTVSGQSEKDGKNYKVECFCDNMSKDELADFVREMGLKKETVKVKKERV